MDNEQNKIWFKEILKRAVEKLVDEVIDIDDDQRHIKAHEIELIKKGI